MSLHELQAHMIEAMFHSKETSALEAVASHIHEQGTLTAAQRVGIYRHSVHGILKQSLKAIYPVCSQLVGDEFLDHLAEQVILESPPNTPFLPEYGKALINQLRMHPALSNMSWVSDVAGLEWARHQAWHSPNQTPLDFSTLANFTPEQQLKLIFELPQSAQLLESKSAIDEIWMAHLPDNKIDLERIQIRKDTYLLIWRAGRSLRQINLEDEQFYFLSSIKSKKSLEELTDQFSEQLPNLLSTSIANQWLISFVAPDS